jgi:D-galactarolactone cycloisomerase
LKITDLRIRSFEYPHEEHPFGPTWQPVPSTAHRMSIVEVHTDEGITGIGSGGMLSSAIEGAKALFVGQDPLATEQHAQQLRNIAYFAGRPWAIEAALWDIVGKAAGLPLYKLLGGYSDRLLAYTSTGERRAPEQRAEDVLRLQEEGFKAVKLRFHSPRARDDLKILEAVRKAVGDSMAVMVDANQAVTLAGDRALHRWDLRTAIDMARALEEMGVYWLEEPLWAYDYDGLAELRRQVNLRIAGAEVALDLHEARTYMERGCYDIYQTDATFAGGVWTARKVAAMAEVRGLKYTPHTWSNGIGLMVNVHVAASVPNSSYIEFPYDPPAWTLEMRDFLLTASIGIDDEGYVRLPDKPGIGVELDEEKCRRYEVEPQPPTVSPCPVPTS